MWVIGYDFDGVFTNIESEKATLFGMTLQKFWDVDPEHASQTWIQNLGTSRRYKFDMLYKDKFSQALEEEKYQEVENALSQALMADYYPNAELVPEVVETVRDLKGSFDLSFISSGVTDSELKSIVSMFGLDQYFDHIFGTNHLYKSKAEHLALITQKHSPEFGIFIGDGLEDMRIARQFNFVAIGLPTNHPSRALLEAGANFISSPGALKVDLDRLLKSNNNRGGHG